MDNSLLKFMLILSFSWNHRHYCNIRYFLSGDH